MSLSLGPSLVIANKPGADAPLYPSVFGARVELVPASGPGEWVVSQIASGGGFLPGSAIEVLSGTGEFRINGGAWQVGPDAFDNGDLLEARNPLPETYETVTLTTYTKGLGTDTFTSNTQPQPVPENSLDFSQGKNSMYIPVI